MKIALINGSPKRKDSASGLILKELQGLIPVSYTHLDVYKRQTYPCP